ncbi:MAG: hypothetical protein ACLR23_28370 [Clostridia bacterium]
MLLQPPVAGTHAGQQLEEKRRTCGTGIETAAQRQRKSRAEKGRAWKIMRVRLLWAVAPS